MVIVAQGMGKQEGEAQEDEGLEVDKLKVLVKGKILACKAADIVWNELGFDEVQIEEGIAKWKLRSDAREEKDLKKS